ncbi:hypothetical protein [Megamonas hypermegale]|uniref:hypothetical protein n=1 Tax=Megamonas hypermegale TaxID=158847 RepID=UPI0026EE41D1|nr:hypothetical protein [Megamonas hypermegale]
MEEITLGQIGIIVSFTAALITGLTVIFKLVSKAATKWIEKCLMPLDKKLDRLEAKVDKVDLSACKNFLVRMFTEIETRDKLGDNERQRIYEVYDRYRKLGGNSYIEDTFNRLRREGKL